MGRLDEQLALELPGERRGSPSRTRSEPHNDRSEPPELRPTPEWSGNSMAWIWGWRDHLFGISCLLLLLVSGFQYMGVSSRAVQSGLLHGEGRRPHPQLPEPCIDIELRSGRWSRGQVPRI